MIEVVKQDPPGGHTPLTIFDLQETEEVASATHFSLPKSENSSAALAWSEVPFDTVPFPVNNYLLKAQPLWPMSPCGHFNHPISQMSLRPGLFCPHPPTSSCLLVPLQLPVTPATCGAISPAPCTDPMPQPGTCLSLHEASVVCPGTAPSKGSALS